MKSLISSIAIAISLVAIMSIDVQGESVPFTTQ